MLERWARPWARLWNGTAGVMDAIYRRLGRPGKLLQVSGDQVEVQGPIVEALVPGRRMLAGGLAVCC